MPRRKTSTRPTPAIGNFAADQRQIREELDAVRGPMEQRLADLMEREKALGEALRETTSVARGDRGDRQGLQAGAGSTAQRAIVHVPGRSAKDPGPGRGRT